MKRDDCVALFIKKRRCVRDAVIRLKIIPVLFLISIIVIGFVASFVVYRLRIAVETNNQVKRMFLVCDNLGGGLSPSSAELIKKVYDDVYHGWPWIFIMEESDYKRFGLQVPKCNSWRSNTSMLMTPNSFDENNEDEGFDNFKTTVYNKEIEWDAVPNISSHYYCYCWIEDPDSPEYSMTNGMTLVGKDTITDALRSKTFPTDVKEIDKILDLIVYVEVNHSGVHWMQSGDLDIENVPEDFTKGMTGLGVAIMFLDGDIWFIDRKCPLENIKTFMTLTGARENDRDALLKPYCLRTWADVFR